MPSRILVTGGLGFVGKTLLARLKVAAPHAELFATSRAGAAGEDGITWLRCDFNGDGVAEAIATAKPTHVVHLAGGSSVAGAASAGPATFETNVLGAVRLADALAETAADARVIFASTGEVYGYAFAAFAEPLSESAPVGPASVYARSKLAAEFALMDRLPATSSLVILRPLNHIGPGQDDRFVVASFARQIAEIETSQRPPVISVGNLSAERDFCDVGDIADAYVSALLDPGAQPGVEVFNLSSGVLRSIRSVLDDLISRTSASCVVEVDPGRMRAADIPRTALCSDRFRTRYGWRPGVSWAITIDSILADARLRFGSAGS